MNASRIVALSVGLLAALCLGLWAGGHPTALPDALRDVFVDDDVALQAEVTDTIEHNFYRKVPASKLRDSSIKGMVRSLHNRFSEYFTPEENKLFGESLSGQFSGVGMNVSEHKRGLRVGGVFPGTPARKAQIKVGDLIIAVNGKSIAGEPSQVSTARIKGRPGTFVTLAVVHHGKPRKVRLKRARIEVPVVAGQLRRVAGHRLGAIGLASFTSGVHGQLRDQITKLQKRGAEGFVLDLRSNGGGLLDEAVLVASAFIPSGRIVTTKGRTKPKVVFNATGDVITRKPVVVLVDRGTASASEIVTAALEQRLHSPVVGQRTFGKGVFGQIYPLSNKGALDLVVGDYYTPNGSSINGKGVKPTVPLGKPVIEDPPKALERALNVLVATVQREKPRR